MKAVVFLGEDQLDIREYPDPVPGPDEVVIRMKASGMCGSDLSHLHGPQRTGSQLVIEGHEPCGVVELVGNAVRPSEARVGDRVMVHHYDGCRTCRYCRSGWTEYCPNARIAYGGLNGDGGHADFMKVPAHTLIRLPDSLSFKTGAAISCGTGTAFGAIKRVGLSADETVAIFGQGPVGLSATQLAVAMGARVIALDVSPERQALARAFGAHEVVDARSNDPVEAIRGLTHGEGAHKTLDTSGASEARAAAVRAARTWGTACYVGERGQVTLDVSPDLLRRQITLVGSWTFSTQGQADCAEFVADHNVAVDKLFTDRWRLDQAEEAYRLFDTQTTGKGVILPS